MNIKRVRKPAGILILAIVVILAATVPAAAIALRVEESGTTCIQSQTPPEKFWISDDGVIHSRGAILTNLDVTNGNYATGNNILTGNLDLNPTSGYGHAYGSFILYPDAYNGIFEGHWSSHISPDGLQGIAIGHGTGDLEGIQLFNQLSSDDPNNPCTISNITVLIP